MRYYIYKYLDKGKIVYIGKSTNLLARINQHKTDKLQGLEDIWIFECNTELEMNSYEYFLIQKYRPNLNVAYNKDYSINNAITQINFIEPELKKFNEQYFQKFKLKHNTNKKIKEIKPLDYSILNKEVETEAVIKENILNLSLFEQKIIVFSMLNNNKFNIAKYIQFNGNTESGRMYEQIRFAINNLQSIGIMCLNGSTFVLNTTAIDFNLPQKYLNMVFNSTTKYFIPILDATYNEKNPKSFYISVDWLIKHSGYGRASDCNKRIIKPICEVLERHGLKTLVEIKKDGRKHLAYIIKIGENKNDD